MDNATADIKRPDVDTPMLDAALFYAQAGFYVFPVSRNKVPCTSSQEYPSERPRYGATRDPVKIRNNFKKFPRANIGIETGIGFFVVEADTPEGHPNLKHGDGIPALEKLVTDNGGWPDTCMSTSPTGSRHYYFQIPPGITIRGGPLVAGVEVLGEGNYVIAPPSVRPIAKGSRELGRYRWLNEIPMAAAPSWLIDLRKVDQHQRFSSVNDDEIDIDKACAALTEMPNGENENYDNETWFRIGLAAWRGSGGDEKVWGAFDHFSRRSKKYNAKTTWRRWNAFHRLRDGDIKPATLYWYADKTVPGWRDRAVEAALASISNAKKTNGATPPNDNEPDPAVEAETVKQDTAGSKQQTPPAGLPILRIKVGEENTNTIRAQEILIDAGAEIYQRSGRLVRPIVEKTDASDGRKTMTARLRDVTADYLNLKICDVMRFEKYDARKKDWVQVRDRQVTVDVISQEGHWLFPKIIGVITTPTMRPDGSLLLNAGYDEATGLLLVAPPPLPLIPDRPTKDDALAQLQILEDLLSECAFIDGDKGVSKAVALSALITPVVRGAFPITPAHCCRAAEMGSGKSYLWDISAAIATGELMPVMSASEDDEAETEKRLTAALSSGQPLVSLDNVNGQLGGNFLCQAIERTILEIRPFHKNTETIRVEARGTSIFMTGNNISLTGDVGRRVITVTLDPRMERPELRRFTKDPVNAIKTNRGKYIAACLTICRAYVVNGRPGKSAPLLSFAGWSDTVRSALIWLGQADCVDSTKSIREEDRSRLNLLAMMTAWLDVVGAFGESSKRTITDMVKLARKTISRNDLTLLNPDLHEAFMAIAGEHNAFGEPIINEAVAFNWFRNNKNRVVKNMRFTNKANAKGGSQWWVEHVGGEAGEKQYWVERLAEQDAAEAARSDDDGAGF
jgi:putative DNA primase/helicase